MITSVCCFACFKALKSGGDTQSTSKEDTSGITDGKKCQQKAPSLDIMEHLSVSLLELLSDENIGFFIILYYFLKDYVEY